MATQFNVEQILGLCLIVIVWCIISPLAIYWTYSIGKKIDLIIMKKRHIGLTLILCSLCIIWLAAIFPLFVFRNTLILYLSPLAQHYIDIYLHVMLPIFSLYIAFLLFVKFWLMYFHFNWTKISLNSVWIHIRQPSSKDKRANTLDYQRGKHILDSWFVKNKESFGNIQWIMTVLILVLIIISMIIFVSICLGFYGTISNVIYFLLWMLPSVASIILFIKTPNCNDQLFYKAEMKMITFNLLVGILGRTICLIYYSYILFILYSLITICFLILIQTYWLLRQCKNTFHLYHNTDLDIQAKHGILDNALNIENVLNEFIFHLSGELSLECLLALIEINQFKHLLEIYASQLLSLNSIHVHNSITRSSIVHNKKYAKMRAPDRCRKIARKLTEKYIVRNAQFELPINAKVKQEIAAWVAVNCQCKNRIYPRCNMDVYANLYQLFDKCFDQIYDLLAQSCYRFYKMEQVKRSSSAIAMNQAGHQILSPPGPTGTTGTTNNTIQLQLQLQSVVSTSVQQKEKENENTDCILIRKMFADCAAAALLDSNSSESKDIEKLFYDGCISMKYLLKIHENYERNLNVYQSILSVKKNKNEKILFHGTSLSNMRKIVCNGFNRDYNVRSLYGRGTYFTSDAKYALKYAQHIVELDCYAVLVCRVVIGTYTLGMKHMDEELLFQADKQTLYDSLVNDTNNPTIFVINRDYHAIPVYIAILKRDH